MGELIFMINKIKLYVILAVMVYPCISGWGGNTESFDLRANGSIPVWLTAGPLPYDPPMDAGQIAAGGYYKDFLRPYGGENQAVFAEGNPLAFFPKGETQWHASISNADGILDFIQVFNANMTMEGVAYAFCQLTAEKEQEVLLKVRSNDGVRVWFNQELVDDHHVGRKLDQDEDLIRVIMKQGQNRLLAKVDQKGGGWGLGLKVVKPNQDPVEGIAVTVTLEQPLKGRIARAEFTPENLMVHTPEGNRQIIRAYIVSGGISQLRLKVESESWENPVEIAKAEVPFGNHDFEIYVPPVTKPFHVTLNTPGEEKQYRDIPNKPFREWTVNLVQHVHTDIGYTRPQTEILAEHLRYIDYALDYCDQTDHYPEDAKFRWTCEITWAVREYIQRRPPEQVQRLKRRIQEGRIEVAGMFLNLSDIATESALAASLQPVRLLSEEHKIPIRSAMQNDVNGIGWCLVDYFSGIGIDYLTMGVNKTRSLLPFDLPTVFWWESPSGKRIMAFRADHYHTPNQWKIHEGDVDRLKPGLLGHLKFLEENHYPFDRISLNFSGYLTDNSPPATIECDVVKKWNEQYVWPKLKLATAHEFADYIKANYTDTLPVYRKAWPDWWADGFGSAARETSEARTTHTAMQVTDSLLALAALSGAEIPHETMKRENWVHDNLLFYDEHTYGAEESIDDPMSENSTVQWGEKSSYAWEAVKSAGMLREEAWGLMQTFLPRNKISTIAAVNTLNWERSGLIELFIDHQILPLDKEVRILDPVSRETVPAQLIKTRSEGSYWALWAEHIPALGYKTFQIEIGNPLKSSPDRNMDEQLKMENDYYAITLDRQSGAVTELIDKESQKNLVDSKAPWALGQMIYETMAQGRDFHAEAFKRSSVKNVQIHPSSDGPIWKSVIAEAQLDGSERVSMEIRLYHSQKQITFHYSIRKKAVSQAEAVYVAFPFAYPNARIQYEAQGGLVDPEKDQIPRTSADWQSIQNFITVHHDNGQMVLVSPQCPLVQLGDINLGKWQETATIEHPYIYSWIMNNYWYTNFRVSQEGDFRWEYTLVTTPDKENRAATRIGWGAQIPLIARVIPADPGSARNVESSGSLLQLNHPNLLLVDSYPSRYGEGIILHLREIKGEKTVLDVKDLSGKIKIKQADEVNVIEMSIQKQLSQIEFEPNSIKFIKLSFH